MELAFCMGGSSLRVWRRRGTQIRSVGGRWGDRRASCRARARSRFRHQARPHVGNLCGIDDEHRHAAGGARRHEEQRTFDRIFDRLSVRRDRPDFLHLFHDAAGEARFSVQSAALSHGRDLGRRRHSPAKRSKRSARLPDGVQVSMLRKGGQSVVPTADMVVASGDGVMVVAEAGDAHCASGGQAGATWSPAES